MNEGAIGFEDPEEFSDQLKETVRYHGFNRKQKFFNIGSV